MIREIKDFCKFIIPLVCGVGFGVFLVSATAKADHRPPMKVEIGSTARVSTVVCDTAEFVDEIAKAHAEGGMALSRPVFEKYAQQMGPFGRLCGMVEGTFMVTAIKTVHKPAVENHTVTTVEVLIQLPNGTMYPRPGYTLIINAQPAEV